MTTQPARRCVNCGDTVRKGANLGQAVAWMNACKPCSEVAMQHLTLVPDRSIGSMLVYECQDCGGMRTCREGWRTHCHTCLDERFRPDPELAELDEETLRLIVTDPSESSYVREVLDLPVAQPLTIEDVMHIDGIEALNGEFDRYARTGWTVVSVDVCGLPWRGERNSSRSHGVVGVHDVCQTPQPMKEGALDCVTCGPAPDSRTHRARKDDLYLLYLVRFDAWFKFGVGNGPRVREHLRHGAELIQVLQGKHSDVVAAELQLKRRFREHAAPPAVIGMPKSFGERTEVVPASLPIALGDVLQGLDVSSLFTRFSPAGSDWNLPTASPQGETRE